jgi:DNA-binding transcriptional LysR family regulator
VNEIDGWLPPLQALRAFVAAVRARSFAGAAAELRLTHGAISHHVAQVEHLVDAKLFERHRRGVTPTPEAVRLAERIGGSLQALRSALAEARRGSRPMLTVTTTPAFAQRWLLPRFGAFRAAHPDIDLNIRPTPEVLDFDLDGVDIAIRYGNGGWPGLDAQLLAPERLYPVVSPTFRDGDLPTRPGDLLDCVLIRSPRQAWRPWFEAAGLDVEEPSAGPVVADFGLALDLADRGEGVALARDTLASADLAAGRLVRLFPIDIEDSGGYHLLRRRDPHRGPAAEVFATWVIQEMARQSNTNLSRPAVEQVCPVTALDSKNLS